MSLDRTSEQLLPRDAAVESLGEELNDGLSPLLPEPGSAMTMMMMMMMTMTMMILPGLDVLAMVHEQPQPPCQPVALPPGQQRQPQRDDGGVHGRVLRVGGQAGAEVRGTPGAGGDILTNNYLLSSPGEHGTLECCVLQPLYTASLAHRPATPLTHRPAHPPRAARVTC